SLGQQRTNGRETNEYHVHCPLVTDFLSVVGFDRREQQLGGPTPGVIEQPSTGPLSTTVPSRSRLRLSHARRATPLSAVVINTVIPSSARTRSNTVNTAGVSAAVRPAVGSSATNTDGFAASETARARRVRCPRASSAGGREAPRASPTTSSSLPTCSRRRAPSKPRRSNGAATLPATVRSCCSSVSSSTKPICLRNRRRRRVSASTVSTPSRCTAPESGCCRRATQWANVDFPAPAAPTIPCNDPVPISRLTLCSARTGAAPRLLDGKDLLTLSTVITNAPRLRERSDVRT